MGKEEKDNGGSHKSRGVGPIRVDLHFKVDNRTPDKSHMQHSVLYRVPESIGFFFPFHRFEGVNA